jgi:hypothetical protein
MRKTQNWLAFVLIFAYGLAMKEPVNSPPPDRAETLFPGLPGPREIAAHPDAGAAFPMGRPFHENNVLEAKRRLPLPLLMERRGLADHAKPSAFCPFHENTRTKAFSTFQDERGLWRWKCHSQCGSGDEITLLERLDGLSNGEATRQYLAAAGVTTGERASFPAPRAFTPSPRPAAPPRPLPKFPPMEQGNAGDLARLGELRRLSPAAVLLATYAGLLRFAVLRGQRAWIITDNERLNAQARRLDGKIWEHIGVKAWTLPGSWASHPIGRKLAKPYPHVLLVEGGPDLLAALHFMIPEGREGDCCPVAMLGATQRIPASAFPILAGKHVRIFPHTDPPGRAAGQAWARQMAQAGAAKTDAYEFTGLRRVTGEPVEDLNDCTTIHNDDTNQLKRLLP